MNPLASPIERLAEARTALVLDHPFFGSLALRLKLVEAPAKTDTMATDGTAIYFDSAFVQAATDAELQGVIAHEVLHCGLQHHIRREGREPKRFNKAADYAINPMLLKEGFTLPTGALVEARFAGMNVEAIYPLLPPEQQDEQQGGSGGQQGAQGSAPQSGPAGGVLDAPDPIEAAAEWQVATIQATQAARMMGRLPGHLTEAIEAQKRSETDWRAMLQRFVQQSATADYSWRMPNRRYIASGIYMPALRSEQMPPLVVLIDTSGSTRPYRAEFVGHIQTIVDECKPERTYLIQVDTEVAKVDVFERDEPLTLTEISGGGGTRFEPGFEYIEAEGIQPACIVYLTDGEGSFPAPCDVPTLWAITTDVQAPWGETVRIGE